MNGEKETWSRTEEVWSKVAAILNGGVIAQVETKQAETREYLSEVEERLNEIIRQATADTEEDDVVIPESAAAMPTGTVNQEILKAIGGINLLTDKELKFRLTAFVDDYRRILTQNREPEKTQIVEELEEFFEKGSLDYVDMEVETEEMKRALALVEDEADKSKRLREELLSQLLQIKTERDQKAIIEAAKSSRTSTALGLVNPSQMITDKKKSALEEVIDILNRPKVVQALGHEDHSIVMNYINETTITTKGKKTKNPVKDAT